MNTPKDVLVLREALQRLLHAYEVDVERIPNQTVLLSWQTNTQAIQQARDALAWTA